LSISRGKAAGNYFIFSESCWLADGDLFCVYREEGATAHGGVVRSTDGGKTWCAPIPIGKDRGLRLDAETDFVRLKAGTLYAALRGYRVNMHSATSPEGGLAWSEVKDIGFPGHCSHFTRLRQGKPLLTRRLPRTSLHVGRDEDKMWRGLIDRRTEGRHRARGISSGRPWQRSSGRRFKLKEVGIEFLHAGSQ